MRVTFPRARWKTSGERLVRSVPLVTLADAHRLPHRCTVRRAFHQLPNELEHLALQSPIRRQLSDARAKSGEVVRAQKS